LLFTLSKTQELYLLASSSTSAAASGGSLPFGAPATQGANSSGASAEFAAAAWTSGESAYAMTRFGSLQREAFSCYVAGVYYLSQRQLDKARRWLQRALLRQPRLVEAHIAMGHAYALEDESDQAVAAYRQAGRLAPNAHLPLVFLAQEYMATENWVLADAALVDATARNSADAGVWNEYGVLKAKRGQLDVAVMHFERAVSLCSDAPEFVLNLAHAKRRLGDLEAAVSLYETCIALRPHDAEIQFALGIALHMLGDVDRAVVAYHKAQALNPQHEHAALAKFFRLAMEDAASLPVNFDKFDAHD
jgi:anaphase-promoting complex subunit 6